MDEPMNVLFTSEPQGPNALWHDDYRWHMAHPGEMYRVRAHVLAEVALPDAEWPLVTGMLVMFVAGINGPRRLRVPLFAGDDPAERAVQALTINTPVDEITRAALARARREG